MREASKVVALTTTSTEQKTSKFDVPSDFTLPCAT